MKITKYIRDSLKNTIRKTSEIEKIVRNIDNAPAMLDYFSLTVRMRDREICFDELGEFLDNHAEINPDLILDFRLSMRHEFGALKVETVLIHCGDCLWVSFSSMDKNILALLFDKTEQVFAPKKYFMYSKKRPGRAVIQLNHCVQILNRLDDAQYRKLKDFENEKDFQNFIYPILKVYFPNLLDEFYLPRFGNISYKPDFGLKQIGVLIEAKFIREKSDLNKIQKELHDDIIGYLTASKDYKKIVFVIYNKQNIAISSNFIDDLKKVRSVRDVIFCKGIA